jgi:hypothetical protein
MHWAMLQPVDQSGTILPRSCNAVTETWKNYGDIGWTLLFGHKDRNIFTSSQQTALTVLFVYGEKAVNAAKKLTFLM